MSHYPTIAEQRTQNVMEKSKQRALDEAAQRKPQESGTIQPRSKEQEIESIKRTLYNAIDKLDRLTAK